LPKYTKRTSRSVFLLTLYLAMKQHATKLQDRVEIRIAPVFITGTATAKTTLCMRIVDRRARDIAKATRQATYVQT
jgi:hypothetical protein